MLFFFRLDKWKSKGKTAVSVQMSQEGLSEGLCESVVFTTKSRLIFCADTYVYVSVCVSKEVTLVAGLVGKAGGLAIPSSLRV